MQFFCAPVLGILSDRFGRRPVLLAALLALGCDYLIMGFAPAIGWLFAGRLIAGVAGASFTPAYAYVADVTPPERRAQSFGLVGAAFGIGFIVGPAIGGLLGGLGRGHRSLPRAPSRSPTPRSVTSPFPNRCRSGCGARFTGPGPIRSAPCCRC